MSENRSDIVVSQQHAERPPPIALGINVEKPKFPQYAVYAKRMESFDAWPEYLPIKKDDLVEAGLVYTGVGDSVRCYFCGGGLRNWEQGDVPMEEHAKWYPKCPHILLVKGQAYVEKLGRGEKPEENSSSVQTDSAIARSNHLESAAAQSCIEMDYSKEMVQRAIDLFIDRYGNNDFKGKDLCEIIFELEEQLTEGLPYMSSHGVNCRRHIPTVDEELESMEGPNLLGSVAAQSCIALDFSKKMVHRAINIFIDRYGNSDFKAKDLCKILYELEGEPTGSSQFVSDTVIDCRSHVHDVSEELESREMQTMGNNLGEESSSVQTDLAMDGLNYLGSVAVQSCIEMDFSKEMVKKAIDIFIDRYGNSDFKAKDLGKILYELEEEPTGSLQFVSEETESL